MKNRKWLVLLLALVMVLSVTATAFAGISSQDKNQWLIDKGYIKGRYDGGRINYAFNDTIDRDEITRLIVLASGYEKNIEDYKSRKCLFKDVPARHWGIGEINLATSLGMLVGYPDGTFHPDGKVTFAELCAMLVRLDARWANVKVDSLAWPQGYINLAQQYGILTDVASPLPNTQVTRDMAFDMLYNFINRYGNYTTVSFDPNGATQGYAPVSITEKPGKSVNLPGRNTLYRTGYEFVGWSESSNSTNVITGDYTWPANDKTLYAVWSARPTGLVTVFLDMNDGSIPDSQALVPNSLFMLPSPTRVGYNFQGWSTDKNAISGITGLYTVPRENVTLYATWSYSPGNLVGVTLVENPGIQPKYQELAPGSSFILPNPTRDGLVFQGWSEDQNADSGVTGLYIVPNYDVTLYAIWLVPPINMVTVSFDAQNGTRATSKDYPAGSTIDLPDEPYSPMFKTTFLGWSEDRNADSGSTSWYTVPNYDVTLYAIWQ